MWGKLETEILTLNFAESFQELNRDGSGVVEMNLTEVNRTLMNKSGCSYCHFCLTLLVAVLVALLDHVWLKSSTRRCEVDVPAAWKIPQSNTQPSPATCV